MHASVIAVKRDIDRAVALVALECSAGVEYGGQH
jgi:hypothetical protein